MGDDVSERREVDVEPHQEAAGLQYLVTSSEVAEVVGVGRSTVSNWR